MRGTATDSDAIKTKLKQMEDSWAKAFLDKDHGVAVISGMLADDFAGYSSKGEMVDKSKLLDTYRNNTDTITASTNADMQVHVYDKDLASVTGTSSQWQLAMHWRGCDRVPCEKVKARRSCVYVDSGF